MLPPPLPLGSAYTSCYCEENVYLLCQEFLQTPSVKELWEIFAVFISNVNKTVALWNQKAAHFPGSPVVWDYHVVLILRPRRKAQIKEMHAWVYDFDTTLEVPHTWEEYVRQTFPEVIPPAYESKFRIIEGEQYTEKFASDRSHMLKNTAADADRIYLSPPPSYAPICGPLAMQKGITNNLMSDYVNMSTIDGMEVQGIILDRKNTINFFEKFSL